MSPHARQFIQNLEHHRRCSVVVGDSIGGLDLMPPSFGGLEVETLHPKTILEPSVEGTGASGARTIRRFST
jgi:hypothetical protein